MTDLPKEGAAWEAFKENFRKANPVYDHALNDPDISPILKTITRRILDDPLAMDKDLYYVTYLLETKQITDPKVEPDTDGH